MFKKITLLIFIGILISLTLAETPQIGGKFNFVSPLNNRNSGQLDYKNTLAELFVSFTRFELEIDLKVLNPSTYDTLCVRQAYIKLPLMNGQLLFGNIRTGIGELNYYSILVPQGSFGKEIEGMGIRFHSQPGDTKIDIGNLGNILADSGNSIQDRIMYAQLALADVSGFPLTFAGIMTTRPALAKSNIDVMSTIECKFIPNFSINITGKINIIQDILALTKYMAGAIAIKYTLEPFQAYSSFCVGVNSDTKVNDTDQDLILGLAYIADKDLRLVWETQNAKLNNIASLASTIIGIEMKF